MRIPSSLGTRSSQNARVLIVDDSKMNRKMVAKTLQLRGYMCEEAEDGKKALDMVVTSMTMGASAADDASSVPARGKDVKQSEIRNAEESKRKLSDPQNPVYPLHGVATAPVLIAREASGLSAPSAPGPAADWSKMAYNAVLIDYQMPSMDGPASTRAMRAAGYEGLIIGVTGNGMQHDTHS
jgi:CheY-like chemotaxis protein